MCGKATLLTEMKLTSIAEELDSEKKLGEDHRAARNER